MRWFAGGLLLLALSLPATALAAETSAAAPLWEFGLRGGIDAKTVEESYSAGEAYLTRRLPWRVETGVGPLVTRLDLGAGYLKGAGDSGSWLAAGADVVWIVGSGPVELEAGFRPTWLTDHRYGEDNFGGDLQFSSHAGVALHLDRFVLSYQFLHMSNAGLYDENDGLNLHLFGIGVRF